MSIESKNKPISQGSLATFFNRLKEVFAAKEHSHDDKYYTKEITDQKFSKVENKSSDEILSELTVDHIASAIENSETPLYGGISDEEINQICQIFESKSAEGVEF